MFLYIILLPDFVYLEYNMGQSILKTDKIIDEFIAEAVFAPLTLGKRKVLLSIL
jgi:hypothetical protein